MTKDDLIKELESVRDRIQAQIDWLRESSIVVDVDQVMEAAHAPPPPRRYTIVDRDRGVYLGRDDAGDLWSNECGTFTVAPTWEFEEDAQRFALELGGSIVVCAVAPASGDYIDTSEMEAQGVFSLIPVKSVPPSPWFVEMDMQGRILDSSDIRAGKCSAAGPMALTCTQPAGHVGLHSARVSEGVRSWDTSPKGLRVPSAGSPRTSGPTVSDAAGPEPQASDTPPAQPSGEAEGAGGETIGELIEMAAGIIKGAVVEVLGKPLGEALEDLSPNPPIDSEGGEQPPETTTENEEQPDPEVVDDDEEEEKEEGEEEEPSELQPEGDRTAPLVCDLKEAQYNARDVLSMCRVYPLVLDDVEHTETMDVYLTDREMAHLALQMTRYGMPVDLEERQRVGDHLREIREHAIEVLKPFTEGANFDRFVEFVASEQAAVIRKPKSKPDMATGMTDPVTGLVHSPESAFAWRKARRIEEFKKKLAKHGVKYTASAQQAAILRVAGVTLTRRTEKAKKLQINKDVLESHVYRFPVARALLDFVLTSAAIRTFIDGMVVHPDKRLRPEWKVHQITGRWASHKNVQNWSKRAGGGVENLRRMIAAEPGYRIIGADQAQLEARLIAGCSQDAFLLDVFNRKADLHGEITGLWLPEWPKVAEIFKSHKGQDCGLPPRCPKCGASEFKPGKGVCLGCSAFVEAKCDMCRRRDKMRDQTKRLEYGGVFYGGTPEGVWEAVVKDVPDLKIEHVRYFCETMAKKITGVVTWRSELINAVLKTGEIRSPILGRREVFPMAAMGRVDPTVIFNFQPQSGAADLWDLGAIEFCKRWDQHDLAGPRIFHNGHDSVLIHTPEAQIEQVSKDIHECWERRWNNVDFLMDIKVGERWSET